MKKYFLSMIVYLCLQGCGVDESTPKEELKAKQASIVYTLPSSFLGHWKGTHHNGHYTYFINLHLRRVGPSTYDYDYKYARIRCQGRFELIHGDSTTTKLRFKEVISVAKSSSACLSGGYITLEKRLSDDNLDFTWHESETVTYGRKSTLSKAEL